MASKSAHLLLATYNSSIDLRCCPRHSAMIFSLSCMDFSSAAIRASLGKQELTTYKVFKVGLARHEPPHHIVIIMCL